MKNSQSCRSLVDERHIFNLANITNTRYFQSPIEPSHEIMVLFVLRKLILQTRMRSHSLGISKIILP